MTEARDSRPQHSFLFRFIAFVSHLQVGYRLRTAHHPRVSLAFYVILAGALSLGILTTAAYMTSLPLVFVPLAASAFVLFYHPMAKRACPRDVILSHTIGLVMGLIALVFFRCLFPESNVLNPWIMCWPRVAANTLAMGMVCAGMILARCTHSPGAATALIASTGFIVRLPQVFGFMAAVLLLVAGAVIVNRFFGGIPYPLWNHDPEAARDYPDLDDVSDANKSFWHRFSKKTFLHR